MFDSLINRNEYYSNHYLDVLIQNDLAGLRSAWDKAEQRGEATARTRIRALGRAYFAAKTRAAQRALPDPDDIRAIHDSVLIALGFTPDRSPRRFMRGDAHIDVPLAAVCDTHTGLLLVALDAGLAADVDQVLDNDRHAPGALLSPIGADRPVREQVTAAADAVSLLFATEEAPRYVLVLAGGIVVLADRNAWGEGRFLAADIDLALSRNDTKAKGELETIAALFSADALIPDEGPSIADTLTAASHKHAVGVSKDLRDGIRLSVELLANEVITQRLAANQAVYNIDGLARDLTRQCLRFLYRLLFLLYAEARPELQIVPKDHPEYDEGYGLDRLRDLALTPLTTDSARDGGHLHESLKLLFRLVNDGHGHASAAQSIFGTSEGIGLRFEPLHSELFAPRATPLLDGVKLRNNVLQQVLSLLMLSREAKGKARGFVSYANLGINQLGAVYEGLMAYTGFFATDDLYEVSVPGAAARGTWVLPVTQAGDLPVEVFLTRAHPETGDAVRVLHRKGTFVFRLSGRDRQRSASYYTPEVLTRCVVRHALAELLDQNETTTPATRILDLSICEPALGSGAFLNEAINQLAAEYLHRRQAELGRSIEPDAYPTELQKVKAHLALHQCYGVDLNATAVELAEVSLWLNATYPGLQAPWFGLHLRRGNSLVGARRATYARSQLAKSAWLSAAPTDCKLAGGPIADGAIHHFLLPAQGWAAVADTKQARELRPANAARLKEWRKTVLRTPAENDARRLVALARRVEALWTQAAQRVRLAQRDLHRAISVWGAEVKGVRTGPLSRAVVEDVLRDSGSPLGRLRLVMDAWCALWFWPIDGPTDIPDPPTFARWLDFLEGILGVQPIDAPLGQLALFDPADLDSLVERDRQLQFDWGMRAVEDVVAKHPWLSEVRRIADTEGLWHWELEFAPVFQRGGFDLQVGNPPWVRPTWQDDVSLAEFDPWFGVTDNPPVARFADRRTEALAPLENQLAYLADVASSAGLNEHLGSPSLHPLLSGVQTNLYMVFMDTVWRHLGPSGVASLLHPESHFTDPKAAPVRRAAYGRLRRHFQFANGLFLFEDVHDTTFFGIHVYGASRTISFLQLSYLQHPDIIDASLEHDGVGELPTIQFPWGGWDLRRSRTTREILARYIGRNPKLLGSATVRCKHSSHSSTSRGGQATGEIAWTVRFRPWIPALDETGARVDLRPSECWVDLPEVQIDLSLPTVNLPAAIGDILGCGNPRRLTVEALTAGLERLAMRWPEPNGAPAEALKTADWLFAHLHAALRSRGSHDLRCPILSMSSSGRCWSSSPLLGDIEGLGALSGIEWITPNRHTRTYKALGLRRASEVIESRPLPIGQTMDDDLLTYLRRIELYALLEPESDNLGRLGFRIAKLDQTTADELDIELTHETHTVRTTQPFYLRPVLDKRKRLNGAKLFLRSDWRDHIQAVAGRVADYLDEPDMTDRLLHFLSDPPGALKLHLVDEDSIANAEAALQKYRRRESDVPLANPHEGVVES